MKSLGKQDIKLRLADVDTTDKLFCADIYYHRRCHDSFMYTSESCQCVICKEDLSPSQKNQPSCDQVKKMISIATAAGDESLISALHSCYNTERNTFMKASFCHTSCCNNYITSSKGTVNSFYECYVDPLINDVLSKGYAISLSDINACLSEATTDFKFHNNCIKDYINLKYAERVSYFTPHRRNDSLVVYPSHISPTEILKRMQSLDIMKTAGGTLRNILRHDTNFNLNDSFCDKHELLNSWLTTHMSDEMATFLSSLLNVPKVKLINNRVLESVLEVGDDDTSDEDIGENDHSGGAIKVIRSHGIHQTLFYAANNGRKLAPMQVMSANSIYEKCKSRTLITEQNKLAQSISYPTLLKMRNNLCAYTVEKARGQKVPLPSHMNTTDYILCAFDNFDHSDRSSTSGTEGSHDTVSVVFQNVGIPPLRKGTLSDFPGTICYGRKHQQPLPCQKVIPIHLPNRKKAPFPTSFFSTPALTYEDDSSDEVINLIQSCNRAPSSDENMPSWVGVRSLVSKSNLTLKRVGFLPIMPAPVTSHSTVYSCILNFIDVCQNMQQPCVAVVCDEGVYQYIVDIYLAKPHLFESVYFMLGGFHMIKAALRCIGTYLTGSGIEDALIETGIFGVKTLEQVLTGKNYARAIYSMLVIEETIRRLQWESFWDQADLEKYVDEESILQSLRHIIKQRDHKKIKDLFWRVVSDNTCNDLQNDFNNFMEKKTSESQQCKYWSNVLRMMSTVKLLIKADRDGNFLLHINAVGEVLPIFAALDGINYLRCLMFYHETLKALPTTHPYLYQQFLLGNFVVKTNVGSFNAVPADMKLEQSINRSAKSTSGIIGQQKCLQYVTEWQLIYHEVLDIANAYRQLLHSDTTRTELYLHRDLSSFKVSQKNDAVSSLKTFIIERGNPYFNGETILKNFVTQVQSQPNVASRILAVFEEGNNKVKKLRDSVYIEKSALYHDRISQNNLPRIDCVTGATQSQIAVLSSKKAAASTEKALKILYIAKEKCGSLEHVAKYDITASSLFDGNEVTAVKNKSNLMTQLEKRLTADDYTFNKTLLEPNITSLVIDFMSFTRSFGSTINHNEFNTFREVMDYLTSISVSICRHHSVHYILDSYCDPSLKSSERNRRNASFIKLASIDSQTPIPVQMDKFWGCDQNKVLFQQYASNFLTSNFQTYSQSEVVVSGVIHDDNSTPAKLATSESVVLDIPALQLRIEEADMRLIPHVHWLLSTSSKVVVISNDTDVLCLLLFYADKFFKDGMTELWLRVGVASSRRFIPVHILAHRLGSDACRTILKAHIGSGCDYLSRVATKCGALKATPEQYLGSFAESDSLSYAEIINAENYLVHACQAGSSAETFDMLRVGYLKKRHCVLQLPPTSFSIRYGHIPRWWYLTKYSMSLLMVNSWDKSPLDYGWKISESGNYLPVKYLNLLPDVFSSRCSCTADCSTRKCSCKKWNTFCSDYCACSACKNKS